MGEPIVVKTIRHGQTEFNAQKRYAGSLDVPLNAVGRAEVTRAAELLDVSADVVFSSTLGRAVETAHLLSGGAHEIITSELCRERDFGAMQALTSDETEALEPPVEYFRMGGDFHSLNPPGGETLPALRRRAARFSDFVASELTPGSTALVVSHEVFLLQFHGLLRGETWRTAMRHVLPNLTVTTFTIQNRRLLSETHQSLPVAQK